MVVAQIAFTEPNGRNLIGRSPSLNDDDNGIAEKMLERASGAAKGLGKSCPRPSGWCPGWSGRTFLMLDCDDDGIPDPVCSDSTGNFGVIPSTTWPTCKSTWPNGECTIARKCPSGFLYFQDGCYLFSDKTAHWDEARLDCQKHGRYDLAIVDNEELNEFLSLNAKGHSWIGLQDKSNEGSFIWIDGEALAYSNWNAGEPNDLGDEDCAEIRPNTNGKWNDLRCNTHSRRYICGPKRNYVVVP